MKLQVPHLNKPTVGWFADALGKVFDDCLPFGVRKWLLQRQSPTLIVCPQGREALLVRALGGERTTLTVLDTRSEASSITALVPRPHKGWRETVVELPAFQVLTRQVTFPVQVKDKLHQVIGYEIDRLTPFRSENVYYDAKITDLLSRGSKLEVRLAVCRRDQADVWLERLRYLGSPPARLSWPGAWEGANLIPKAQRKRSVNYSLLINLGLFMVIALLVAAVMYSPLEQKNRELEQYTQALRNIRIEAEQVPVIREELERARTGSLAVLERKAAQPRMIDLLRELTDRLPDHTWIQTVNFRSDEVDLRGESDQATELLNILEKAPGISNVSFRSPVMQVSQTGKERFHISFRYQRERI